MSPRSTNPQTGEIIPARLVPPKKAEVKPVASISGANLPKINLRDNPELDGQQIIVTKARYNDGAQGGDYGNKPFVIATVFVCPPSREATADDARVLVTGSGNVFERILDALNENALPVFGTLRRSGRAWFLD